MPQDYAPIPPGSDSQRDPSTPSGRTPLDERIVMGVVLVALLVIAGVVVARQVQKQRTASRAGWAEEQGTFTSGPARQLMDFNLTNFTGQSVTRADLQGKWLIVNFVFSSCSFSCMQVNYRMAEIQKLVALQPDVRLVSLTVDPVSDTPPVLAKFAARFNADSNRWHFLTGEKRVLYPLIGRSFLGPEDPKLATLIPGRWDKVDRIALVDPKGRLRGLFDGMRPRIASEVFTALTRLKLSEGGDIKSAGTKATATTGTMAVAAHEPRPRFALTNIPDFSFTNEFGRPVSLRDFPGQAIAVTFFFTRCPVEEFCPRLTKNFAAASSRLAAMPGGPTNWHLFSISFDPADSPALLRAYALRNNYDSNHWSFLTGPSNQMTELARGFGVKATPQDGTLSHGFATVVFNADGRLQARWPVGGDTSGGLVSELVKAAGTNGLKISP